MWAWHDSTDYGATARPSTCLLAPLRPVKSIPGIAPVLRAHQLPGSHIQSSRRRDDIPSSGNHSSRRAFF
ncbi:hypothetical protein VTH06DRAFT_482 [Thermothelomyces fergusii]